MQRKAVTCSAGMEGTAMDERLFDTSSIAVQLPQPVAAFVSATKADEPRSYLRTCCAAPWCFLTAHDPGGIPLSYEENAERTRQTVNCVERLGSKAVTREDMHCPIWLPRWGILVIGIAEREARLLMYELGQGAIVVGGVDYCNIHYAFAE